jgi:hypothetical protein
MPRVINPPSGIVISANHPILPLNVTKPFLGKSFTQGWRAKRIHELIGDPTSYKTKVVKEDFIPVMLDVVSIPARVTNKQQKKKTTKQQLNFLLLTLSRNLDDECMN